MKIKNSLLLILIVFMSLVCHSAQILSEEEAEEREEFIELFLKVLQDESFLAEVLIEHPGMDPNMMARIH